MMFRFIILLVTIILCNTQMLLAQSIGTLQAELLSVYSLDSKSLVATIPIGSEYRIVGSKGNWSTVTFNNPSVPVWLSADYVRQEGSTVVVIANRLNVRFQASITSRILTSVKRGFKSEVLARRNGFVQIYAPSWVEFNLYSGNLASTSLDDQVEVGTVDSSDNYAQSGLDSKISSWKLPPFSNSTPEPIREKAPAEKLTPAAQHLLSPGDTISLQVFGEQDLGVSNVRIPQSGEVSFPLIGSMSVAGKTVKNVEVLLVRALAEGYIKNPKLNITIDAYRPIFIKGAVQNTGSFPFTEGLTVAKMIAIAGGTKASVKKNGVSISRNGLTIQRNLSVESQYAISSGDIISVEEEFGVSEESAFYVYLHGEVKRPGEYLFRRGLTVEKAVVLAGGFTLRASRKKITVSRIVEAEETPVKFKKVKLYLPVKPGDIIDVGASWL